MLANMACSLIEHKRINTTLAKAKYAVTELFKGVAVKVGDRPGGYTRIIKLGNRLGDNAEMAMIEFVDYNTTYNVANKAAKKKTTRRGRKKATEETATEAKAEVKSEVKAEAAE